MANPVRDNPARQRFELDIDGDTAFLGYRLASGVLTLVHTETPPEMRGKGAGSALVRGVLELARTRGLRLVVLCDFVRAYMGKHPEFDDLLI